MDVLQQIESMARDCKQLLQRKAEAEEITPTEIISQDIYIAEYDSTRSEPFTKGELTKVNGIVSKCITAGFVPSHYPQYIPEVNDAQFEVYHTTDPARAVKWIQPNGTSGMYMKNDVYKEDDGNIYRCTQDNNVYRYTEYPSYWELVE